MFNIYIVHNYDGEYSTTTHIQEMKIISHGKFTISFKKKSLRFGLMKSEHEILYISAKIILVMFQVLINFLKKNFISFFR